jgi:hypothetical protein
MRFESRELKAYLETVPAEQLAVGQVYFRVSFADRDLAVPELESVVFIGHDLHPDGPGLYYQDVTSYLEGRRFSPTDLAGTDVFPLDPNLDSVGWEDDSSRFEFERTEASNVCTFDEALEQLMVCSLRRREWNGQLRAVEPVLNGE